MATTTPRRLLQSPGAKVETVGAFLVKGLPSLKGVDIRTGRPEDTEEQDGEEQEAVSPSCDLYATEVKVVPELEDEWTCSLNVRLRVQADDESGRQLDDRVKAVQDALSFPEDVLPQVNFPLASRPVIDFWMVDIYVTDEHVSTTERYYQTTLVFMVKFRDDAGQGGPDGRG